MKNNQSGQSTVEFIFSFIFAVSLILMVFNTSLNYAAGYVVHYATFMASRIYLTQDFSPSEWGPEGAKNDPSKNPKQIFKDSYKLSIFGINSELQINDRPVVGPGEYLMVGAYTQFERKIDLIGQVTGQAKLELISESFLGREPVRGVCASRTCYAITGQDACSPAMDITLFDDGC